MEPSRRAFLVTGAAGLAAATMIGGGQQVAEATPVHKHRPSPAKGSRLLARITPVGSRITTVCLDTGVTLLGCRDLARSFSLTVQVGDTNPTPLAITRAYTRDSASVGETTGGRYVVFELAGLDEKLPQPYRFTAGNTEPMLFREYAADGTIVQRPRVQATQTPEPLGASLVVTVERTAAVVRADGGLLDESRWDVSAAAESLVELDLHGFATGVTSAGGSGKNVLHYRLRRPARRHRRAPLVLFLHGSGQVGTDNLAQVLSSRGATGVLEHEDAYVVAPQAPAVFDAYDSYDEATGKGGGIHWQTRNRRRLLAALVRDVIRRNPGVDPDRVYVVGLSRGAEGGLALLLDEPDLFAGTVLPSGREAGTVEWMSGRATRAKLRPALKTPLWFFHAAQDTVSPVDGSRINVRLLRELGHRDLRYTEVSYESPGDSGYLNTSAHNSWDLAFNSPDVWQWLLGKHRRMR
ncbi:hypothetical protein MLP_31240 [Microlunatus phosphovorus NM-1]|uniref:Acyl-CoA:diacylglycerol acyltransferase n=1 Tax=Microlunatus phosphovorus (strain ATCC 700054 / DSM 10555 / JCM 9379 / NBRC 101784 / NCIMB 13414 / VKM Ac-1990 / NM-1) TaxID=1032480 RepID=F5XKR6_MICPN|nr:PHB depolymerase family esterase [Microlunatus phosphovorus]BAK36138.1 hypothetical protein MLP_31240 [Microlunatus phosphovorus NM-1]